MLCGTRHTKETKKRMSVAQTRRNTNPDKCERGAIWLGDSGWWVLVAVMQGKINYRGIPG